MRLTGTIINYYVHCKRQCWLFYHRVNMEDNSEDVRIGRVLHALQARHKPEVALDNIKLDKITEQYVVEIKKSDADLVAAKAQLQFYLFQLADKGICRRGRLECQEKIKQARKIHYVELNDEVKQELLTMIGEVEKLLQMDKPPAAQREKHCTRCAYFAYCYI